MSSLPLRRRLVAGYIGVMTVLLTAAGALVYWRVDFALDRGLDTELTSAAGVIAPLVQPDGRLTSPDTAAATGAGWQVLDESGRVLSSGGPAPPTPYAAAATLSRVPAGSTLTVDVGSMLPTVVDPTRVRLIRLDDTAYLAVGVGRAHRDEALRELLLQLLLAGGGALVVSALVGDVLARLALRPVERYRVRSEAIAGGASGLRLDVPVDRDDEVTRLGLTLNAMLAAQDEALDRERRFVQDASHELRTPLTLIRSRIQLALRRTRSVAEHEVVLEELAVDVDRLGALTEQLLELASPPVLGGCCDAAEVVPRVVARWAGGVSCRPVGGSPLPVGLDAVDLDRVVTNLVANALTHGRRPVSVAVLHRDSHVVVEVSDAGSGMPEDLLATATRRFARSEDARSRPGTGLGLSLVEELVVTAGGELRLCHAGHHHRARAAGAEPAVGCEHDERMTVSVVLPRVPAN